ncbi:MAG: hypothetical protein Q9187_007119 [Circinaria calcarea]
MSWYAQQSGGVEVSKFEEIAANIKLYSVWMVFIFMALTIVRLWARELPEWLGTWGDLASSMLDTVSAAYMRDQVKLALEEGEQKLEDQARRLAEEHMMEIARLNALHKSQMREKGEMSLMIQGHLRQAHQDERDDLITQLSELRWKQRVDWCPRCRMPAQKLKTENTRRGKLEEALEGPPKQQGVTPDAVQLGPPKQQPLKCANCEKYKVKIADLQQQNKGMVKVVEADASERVKKASESHLRELQIQYKMELSCSKKKLIAEADKQTKAAVRKAKKLCTVRRQCKGRLTRRSEDSIATSVYQNQATAPLPFHAPPPLPSHAPPPLTHSTISNTVTWAPASSTQGLGMMPTGAPPAQMDAISNPTPQPRAPLLASMGPSPIPINSAPVRNLAPSIASNPTPLQGRSRLPGLLGHAIMSSDHQPSVRAAPSLPSPAFGTANAPSQGNNNGGLGQGSTSSATIQNLSASQPQPAVNKPSTSGGTPRKPTIKLLVRKPIPSGTGSMTQGNPFFDCQTTSAALKRLEEWLGKGGNRANMIIRWMDNPMSITQNEYDRLLQDCKHIREYLDSQSTTVQKELLNLTALYTFATYYVYNLYNLPRGFRETLPHLDKHVLKRGVHELRQWGRLSGR